MVGIKWAAELKVSIQRLSYDILSSRILTKRKYIDSMTEINL